MVGFQAAVQLTITNLVGFPVLVKVLETFRRETNRGGTGEPQTARVKELEESVLKNFGESKEARSEYNETIPKLSFTDRTYTVTSSKGPLAKPPMTALAILPIPD
jgi:hypothetical protein